MKKTLKPLVKQCPRNKEYQMQVNKARNSPILNDYQSYLLKDKLLQSEDESDEDFTLKDVDLPFIHRSSSHEHIRKKKSLNSKLTRRQITVQNQSGQPMLSLEYQPNFMVISPDGPFKIVWDTICMLFILYEIFAIPFSISFDVIISQELDLFVDILFLFDILLNFNTSFYHHGSLIESRKKIVENYLRMWFWLDICASFPYSRFFDFIITADKDHALIKQSKILRLLRFFRIIKTMRLLRLAKLKQIFEKIEEIIQLSTSIAAIISFLKLCFFVLFCSHWLGSIFHFIGINEAEEDNWLQINQIYYESWEIKYINSLYWAVSTMTTVGYGDISPETPIERGFGILFLLIATCVFSFTLNTIGNTLQMIAEKKKVEKKMMNEVNRYMKSMKLNHSIQNKVRRYLSYIWDSDCPINLSAVIQNLNEQLKHEITVFVNGSILGNCSMICSLFSKKLLLEITSVFQDYLTYPDEFVFTEKESKDLSRNLFFIQEGNVKIILQKNRQVVHSYKKGNYFGEIAFFSGMARTASAKSEQFSNLFYIEQLKFLEILRHYPMDLEKFYVIKNEIIFNSDYSGVMIGCYNCNQSNHIISNCPSLHFVPDICYLIDVKQKCERVLRKEFARYDHVSFHALKDRKTINGIGQRMMGIAQKYMKVNDECNLVEVEEEKEEEEDSQKKIVKIQNLPIEFKLNEYNQLSSCQIIIFRFHNFGIINTRFRQEKEEKKNFRQNIRNNKKRLTKMFEIQEQQNKMLNCIKEVILNIQELKGAMIKNQDKIDQLQITSDAFFQRNQNAIIYKGFKKQTLQTMVSESSSNESENEEQQMSARMVETIKTYYEQQKINLNLKNLNKIVILHPNYPIEQK